MNRMARHMRRTRPSSSAAALSALLLSSISQTAQAQDAPTMCSCSPTVFTFVLSLDQSCDDNTIEGNPGIDGVFCFTEEGVVVPSAPEPGPNAEEAAAAAAAEEEEGEPTRRNLFRALQDGADPVTEVVSVQFLEFDTSGNLNVINQDDTYADVSLRDGDRLTFNSASSFLDTGEPLADQMDRPALVPGGASLILYGTTADGQVRRNRFFWNYDMNCGRDNQPINVGDEIGWVTVDEVSNAWPAFCPALPANSPTIAPKTNEPTLSPTVSPIRSPTSSPVGTPTTPEPTPEPTLRTSVIPDKPSSGDGMFGKGKSGKAKTPKYSKSTKSSKSSKSAKSKKSKNGKKTKIAKAYPSSSDDGQSSTSSTSKSKSKNKSGKSAKGGKGHRVYGNEAQVSSYYAQRANGGSLRASGLGLALALATSYLFVRL